MATTTTHPPTVSPLAATQKRLATFRQECVDTGTYLAEPTEELKWYTVPATKASYLIHAADAPQSSEEANMATRPPPAQVSVILKVFFFIFDNVYFAEVPSRFLRTIGSSVLKQIGFAKMNEPHLSKRPSSPLSGRCPQTRASPMTSTKQKSIFSS
jgi:hypothetical protein